MGYMALIANISSDFTSIPKKWIQEMKYRCNQPILEFIIFLIKLILKNHFHSTFFHYNR